MKDDNFKQKESLQDQMFQQQPHFQNETPWNKNYFGYLNNNYQQNPKEQKMIKNKQQKFQDIPKTIGKYDLYLKINNEQFFHQNLLKKNKKDAFKEIFDFIENLNLSKEQELILKINISFELKEKAKFYENKIYENLLMEYGNYLVAFK